MMIEVAIRDIYEEYNVWILDYGRDRCIDQCSFSILGPLNVIRGCVKPYFLCRRWVEKHW